MSKIFNDLKNLKKQEKYSVAGIEVQIIEPTFKVRADALKIAKDGDVELYFKAMAALTAACVFDLDGAAVFASAEEVMQLSSSILDPLGERVQALAGLNKREATPDPEADRQTGEPSDAEKKEQSSSAMT